MFPGAKLGFNYVVVLIHSKRFLENLKDEEACGVSGISYSLGNRKLMLLDCVVVLFSFSIG